MILVSLTGTDQVTGGSVHSYGAQRCCMAISRPCTRNLSPTPPLQKNYNTVGLPKSAAGESVYRLLDIQPFSHHIHVDNLLTGPPPTHLGYAYACSLPLKAPPYLRTDKISEPPFRGLFAGFSCLGDPPKSKTLLNVPLIFYFITPFFNFAGVQRERERKTTPFLKEISG